jgi:acetyl esterase/lipase
MTDEKDKKNVQKQYTWFRKADDDDTSDEGNGAAEESRPLKTQIVTDDKEGFLADDQETVEDIRRLYPWFRIEDCRADVVRFGNKYAHPADAEVMSIDTAENQAGNQDPNSTDEELRARRKELFTDLTRARFDQINADHPEFEEYGYWEEYDIDGCPEEPDAPKVHVLARRLRESYKKGPYPAILVAPTGGLFISDPYMYIGAPPTKYFGCQLFCPNIRVFPDAKYPAAQNDLHATYQWMVQHADELDIDADRILLMAYSSGAGLISALPFRLKRYDWCGGPMPRGVVVHDAFMDDRETMRSMRMLDKGWSGLVNRGVTMRYMGKNFASGFIGPEAFANHATIEECEGLPPYAIFEHQDSPGCDSATEFVGKLNEAGVYCNYFVSGGCTHAVPPEAAERIFMLFARETDYEPQPGFDAISRDESFLTFSIKDFLENDYRG